MMDINYVIVILGLCATISLLSVIGSKIPPKLKASEEILKAKVEALKMEIEMWKERGDRLSGSKDEAEKRHEELHKQYLEAVKELRKPLVK